MVRRAFGTHPVGSGYVDGLAAYRGRNLFSGTRMACTLVGMYVGSQHESRVTYRANAQENQ